jgi:ubiquinone/menaquinone biosynthesis C-methylase UbiE
MRDDVGTLFVGEGYSEQYQDDFYRGPIGYVMKSGHRLLEKPFGKVRKFDRVLEIGAGPGAHVHFIDHDFSEYYVTDNSTQMLSQFSSNNDPRIKTMQADAYALPFENETLDRVVASHVLEHLYKPHEVLREWNRVLKPGGVLSLILPCDPGIAWRYGRYVSTHRKNSAKGFPWGYLIAREHVNPINNLVALIRYYFEKYDETWWPFRLPIIDINLVYAVNIWKQ